ncbi:HIT family protein [Calditerrivibrio nitroreducens]|uniref:Histidine triad (HIT) protein n=1 Tax=Calditerrivibrio nitroreducens (strain DSM 19672 / NBRC 101217 / Yu37-1) TaxID=768670 RepID=E4TEK8_CALNY|nr:HIT domain-containing protein [Calditerrivibrio nitroreducens]ADR18334.1 histidine triad (HIT) protein [Calditerrivibrio nitroreducens DSM 19672]
MEKIWAPWRMRYIDGSHKDEGCIFCNKPKENNDRENLIVYRGRFSFAMLNLFPYTNGHTMVAPYRHTAIFEELTRDEVIDIHIVTSIIIKAIKMTMNPDGFNLGYNLGRTAGAGIVDHLHFHIVPRWNGDTNFMPVIGEVKVISEHIEQTYDKILKGIEVMG